MIYRNIIIDGSFLAVSRYKAGNLFGGFLWKIWELKRDWNPGSILVAWDRLPMEGKDYPSIRKEIYPKYKSNRKPKEPEYFMQLEELKSVLPWFDIVQFYGNGEGDDVIYTLCKTRFGPNLIWSADKDLLQIVDEKNHYLKAGVGKKNDVLITDENIKEQTGLTAQEWLYHQALAGDSVDGIPGLSKVGSNRAKAIIEACPNCVDYILKGEHDKAREEVLTNDASMTKWIEKAIQEKDNLEVSLVLVSLYKVKLEWINAELDTPRALNWLFAKSQDRLAEKWMEL